MSVKTLTGSFLLILLSSCSFFTKKQEKRDHGKAALLATVYNSQLYYHQLPAHLRTYSGKDSAAMVTTFINSWIKDELLVHAAEQVIDEDDPEMAEKLKKYRNYLLVSEFKRRYLAKQVDSVVDQQDIEKYYNLYSAEFILEEDLVLGSFIKVPLQAPGLKRIKEQLAKPDKEIKSFCSRYSSGFRLNSWMDLFEIEKHSPFTAEEVSLAGNGTMLEKNDEEFAYILHIKEKRRKGERTPLEFAKPEIERIILNDRRNKVITKLEEEVYNDGKKTKSFELF